jgi:nuclear GTP-binding protein
VGKSSLINSLLKRAALPIYNLASSSRGPSTTEVPQEVALEIDSQKILLIDTPGLAFISDENADESTSEEFRARDILLRNKGRIDRLKDPHPAGMSVAMFYLPMNY